MVRSYRSALCLQAYKDWLTGARSGYPYSDSDGSSDDLELVSNSEYESCESETDTEIDPSDTSSDESEGGDLERAGDEFLSVLIEMLMLSEVTAYKFCQLCYWASKGGLVGST